MASICNACCAGGPLRRQKHDGEPRHQQERTIVQWLWQVQPALCWFLSPHWHGSPHEQAGAYAQALTDVWQPQVQGSPTQFVHWQEEALKSFMAISLGRIRMGSGRGGFSGWEGLRT